MSKVVRNEWDMGEMSEIGLLVSEFLFEKCECANVVELFAEFW